MSGPDDSDSALGNGLEALLRALARGPETPNEPIRDPDLTPGSRVGRYEVVHLIGRGGMGAVYRARDDLLGRDVALKVILMGATDSRVDRFRREIVALASVRHENVVSVHDAGVDGTLPYVVLDLVEGQTLRQRLTIGALGVVETEKLARDLARGLGAAHSVGIVHRDLKPENVLLDRQGTARLVDFGLARLVERDDATELGRTESGVFLGTAGYMAPEQVRGENVDQRADFFALGAVLFEALTGRYAFDGPSRADVLTAVLRDQPASPPALLSDRHARRLLDLTFRCLEKSPERRFQSAAEILAALDAAEPGSESERGPGQDFVGQDIAQFRVLEMLGRGGMGVVYRAEDTKLRRLVALKLLPAGSDSERRERFLREARAAAVVTHPNIAAVYEVDESNGIAYIAMEYIEGVTLRHVLAAGAMPVPRAVEIASAIAAALTGTHAAGIVHRDLKPENVMIARDDTVKLLDFGIAKLTQSADQTALAPTAASLVTERGIVLGSPGYMSPEQCQGLPLDARSDVFSLGIVLYELLTLRCPFQGATPMAVLVAATRDEAPAIASLNRDVPPQLAKIVHRCLEKSPEARYADARELLSDLRRFAAGSQTPNPGLRRLETPSGSAPATLELADTESLPAHVHPTGTRTEPVRPTVWRRRIVVAIGVGVFGAVLATAVVFGRSGAFSQRSSEPHTASASAAPLGGSAPLLLGTSEPSERRLTAHPAGVVTRALAVTDDGSRFAYVEPGWRAVLVRDVSGGEPLRIPAVTGMQIFGLSFFPGRRRLLLSEGAPDQRSALATLDTLTGERKLVREDGQLGVVSPDGKRLAFIDRSGVRVAAVETPGRAKLLKSFPTKETPVCLRWSPGGRFLAWGSDRYTIEGRDGIVEVASLNDGLVRVVAQDTKVTMGGGGGGPAIVWASEDRLLFVSRNPPSEPTGIGLFEQALEPSGLPAGKPRLIASWLNTVVDELAISRDGRRMFFIRTDTHADVGILPLDERGRPAGTIRRITADDRYDVMGAWAPDGKSILFASNRAGDWSIYRQSIDAGHAELFAGGPDWETWPTTGGDGAFFWQVRAVEREEQRTARLMRAPLSGGQPVEVRRAPMEPSIAWDFRPPPYQLWVGCALERDRCADIEGDVSGRVLVHTFSRSGGARKLVTRIEPPDSTNMRADISRDGRRLALVWSDQSEIVIVSLEDRVTRRFTPATVGGKYQYVAWTRDGTGLYVTGGFHRPNGFRFGLARIDLEGRGELLVDNEPTDWIGTPKLSPDGRSLALTTMGWHGDVWLLELER